MTTRRQYEITILEEINQSFRASRVNPLNFGGIGGPGGGLGGPPGGFIGQVPQPYVAYDETEAESLSTAATGIAPPSGRSLVDNLNHIRYRIGQLEDVAGTIIVRDFDTVPTIDPTNTITFSGFVVSDLGGGEALIRPNPLTVREQDGSPTVVGVDNIAFSGATVTDLSNGDVLVQIIPGTSLEVTDDDNSPIVTSTDKIIFSGAAEVFDLGGGDALVYVNPVFSGELSLLTVRDIDEDPTIFNTDTITFSGFIVTDLGGGEALVQPDTTFDSNAIHDNIDGEIAAITQKSIPIATDKILIEDSEDSDSKKYIEVGDISGGSSSDLGILVRYYPQNIDDPTGISDYKLMTNYVPSQGGLLTSATVAADDDVNLWSFITPPKEVSNQYQIPGMHHFRAQIWRNTLTHTTVVYTELYRRETSTTETLLATSDQITVPDAGTMLDFYMETTGIGTWGGDYKDRYVLKIHVIAGNDGSNGTIYFYCAPTNGVEIPLESGNSIHFPSGWQPFAYPLGTIYAGTISSLTLAANGGSLASPVALSGPMMLDSVSVWNTNTSTARTWRWDIYQQIQNNEFVDTRNTLYRVVTRSSDETFTPSAASLRTIGATGAPTYLSPGIYWVVVQSTHATNSFNIGYVTTNAFIANFCQTKTTTNPNGASLDFTAATWTKQNDKQPYVRFNGRVFGSSVF